MPGAQSRRPFEARVASAARRGANVPTGAPGVYRVPRRSVSAVTSDAGLAAAPSVSEWVQPENVTGSTVNFSAFLITQFGTSAPGVDLQDWYNEGVDPGVLYTANASSPAVRWETVLLIVETTDLSMPPTSPAPPPGMTVEYEAAAGTPTQIKVDGNVYTTQGGAGRVNDAYHVIYQITPSTLNPGRLGPYSSQVGPTRPWSGAPVFSYTGSSSFSPVPFDTGYQAWPDGSSRVGWQFGEINSINETEAAEAGNAGLSYGLTVSGPGGSGPLRLTYDYRPPRYRFV